MAAAFYLASLVPIVILILVLFLLSHALIEHGMWST